VTKIEALADQIAKLPSDELNAFRLWFADV